LSDDANKGSKIREKRFRFSEKSCREKSTEWKFPAELTIEKSGFGTD
jgi:hypothetical protein